MRYLVYGDVIDWLDTLTVNEARDVLGRLAASTERREHTPAVIECNCGCGATRPDDGTCECGQAIGHDR